jgi:hypothetical protein
MRIFTVPKLTRDKCDWQAHNDAFKEFIVGGQVKRAACKFGLVAMTVELAIEYRDHPVETDRPGNFSNLLLGPTSTLLGILTVWISAEPSIPGRAANCQNGP